MNHRPGITVPVTGIYWCTVCKLPEQFTAGQEFPECRNLCGRGLWEWVEGECGKPEKSQPPADPGITRQRN